MDKGWVAASVIVVAVGGGGYALSDQRPVYDVPVAVAVDRMAAIDLSDDLDAIGVEMDQITDSVERQGNAIRWRVASGSEPLGTFSATAEGSGSNKTRISVQYTPATAGRFAKVSQFAADDGLISASIDQFIGERIAAAIEQRPFDERLVERRIQAYAAAHPIDTLQFVRKMEQLSGDPEMGAKLLGGDTMTAMEQGSMRPGQPAPEVARPQHDPDQQVEDREREAQQAMRDASKPANDLSQFR